MSYLRSAVYTPCRLPVTMFEISRFSRKEWFLFRADVNCPLIIETVNLKSVDNGEEWVSRPSRFNTILEHGYLAFILYYRQNSYDSNDIFARWKVSICNEGNHFRRAHREYWSRGEILDELVEWTERKSKRFVRWIRFPRDSENIGRSKRKASPRGGDVNVNVSVSMIVERKTCY